MVKAPGILIKNTFFNNNNNNNNSLKKKNEMKQEVGVINSLIRVLIPPQFKHTYIVYIRSKQHSGHVLVNMQKAPAGKHAPVLILTLTNVRQLLRLCSCTDCQLFSSSRFVYCVLNCTNAIYNLAC